MEEIGLKLTKKLENKVLLVAYKGGVCERCNGVFHPSVFDFHHKKSSQKDHKLSSILHHSISKIKKEVDKCFLLCANCHREVHAYPDLRFLI